MKEEQIAIRRFVRTTTMSRGDCQIWTGKLDKDGYGAIWTGQKSFQAHRISFLHANGFLSPGKFVCHSCDTPSCVNPKHLWEGTAKDNSADARAKGRTNKGSRHGLAKLAEADVMKIKHRLSLGEKQNALAKEFGVGNTAISDISRGRCWTHV